MEDSFIQLIDNYGLPIAFVFILLYWIFRTDKSHREERHEWRGSQQRLQDSTNSLMSENNKVIRDLTEVIAKTQSDYNREINHLNREITHLRK